MHNLFKAILFLAIYNVIVQGPIVRVTCNSEMLGNKLFVYCVGRIISKELGFELVCKPICGFPKSYNLVADGLAGLKKQFLKEGSSSLFSLDFIINNRDPRNIFLHGYFQNYQIYKPYKYLIRNDWLKAENKYIQNSDDIVVHVRIEKNDIHFVPFYFFEEALSCAKYRNIYLCTNNPDHPYINNFKKYNPIIRRHQKQYSQEAVLDDFKFIMSFDKIVISPSTFAWWAAFLSDASEIYFPRRQKGFFSREAPNINLFVDDEDRYKYIDC